MISYALYLYLVLAEGTKRLTFISLSNQQPQFLKYESEEQYGSMTESTMTGGDFSALRTLNWHSNFPPTINYNTVRVRNNEPSRYCKYTSFSSKMRLGESWIGLESDLDDEKLVLWIETPG
ncbi:hypothetical protein MTR_2g102970 [Medicago truncatula]|uniref:Uncharacterized protein n=1 Tax=Medicago truncatula TaxID=3880 RepID=A0A072VC28_MEDTR|nr:hypothetical protein MTR_2g102970 [Medicago truncatula]